MKITFTPALKYLIATFVLSVTQIAQVSAQYSERYIPISYLGIELNGGTRSFSLKSNIPAIDKMKVTEEGADLAVFAGSEIAVGKLKVGVFRSGSLVRERIEMQEGELSINAFPLYIFNIKTKLVKPYVLASFDLSNLKFYGNYSLPVVTALPKPPTDCDCIENPDMPGCFDIPFEEELPPSPTPEDNKESNGLLGRVVVSKFDFGTGVWVHLPMKNNFINLFAEAKYGVPVGTKAKDKAFSETKISSGFLIINLGISVGLRN